MTSLTEAQLASRLSDALSDLHQLEAFRTEGQTELGITWTDTTASNTAPSILTMKRAVLDIISDNLQDLFRTAVARQREKVGAARTALLDLQFGKTPPEPIAAHEAAPEMAYVSEFKIGDWVQTAPDAPVMEVMLLVKQEPLSGPYTEALCRIGSASTWYDTRTLMLVPTGTMVPNDAGATAEPAVENLDEVF